MIVLLNLIATFGGALREQYGDRLLPGHERALHALAICRTEDSPVMMVQCPDCGNRETIPHSCGHRNCPHCQHHEGQQCLERQRAKLLPVMYFMVTFTLPGRWTQNTDCGGKRGASTSFMKNAWPRYSAPSGFRQ